MKIPSSPICTTPLATPTSTELRVYMLGSDLLPFPFVMHKWTGCLLDGNGLRRRALILPQLRQTTEERTRRHAVTTVATAFTRGGVAPRV